MKKIIHLSSIIIGTFLLIFTMNSCKKEPVNVDPKEIVEEQNDTIVENDASYLAEIAKIHASEIEIGKLALQKGLRPDIQKYAQLLIDDHTKSLDELKALAIKKTITLPNSVTDAKDEDYNTLKEKSGTDFDDAFVAMMAEDHEKTVDQITEISQKVTDPDVKLWTSRQVTMFTTHSDEAKKLKEKV
ncbi:DUF4142 domain-containing protein [Flavobacterium sp. WC2509]|uniref:DUF4142 domain-containing protein n=1 Tax=Flavobacterium sp. WC2509 TaxID=3461406 RepID=UPI0040450923